MSDNQFACSLQFMESWRATSEQIDVLLDKMTEYLVTAGVEGLRMGGALTDGSLDIAFRVPAVAGGGQSDSLLGLALVVRALNSGRVSAPGWPDDEVVDGAIASVRVLEFSLIEAA